MEEEGEEEKKQVGDKKESAIDASPLKKCFHCISAGIILRERCHLEAGGTERSDSAAKLLWQKMTGTIQRNKHYTVCLCYLKISCFGSVLKRSIIGLQDGKRDFFITGHSRFLFLLHSFFIFYFF